MLPTKWNWKTEHDNDYMSLHRAMNHLFDDFTKNWEFPVYQPVAEKFTNWYPRLDMFEKENELCITLELPGLEEKDIDIVLTGDVLTIKGMKKLEKEEKHGTWFHSERAWGSFQRVLPIPFPVVRDEIKAEFKLGVLYITLPKTAEAKEYVKKIPVKSI
jgi:HSP20 family protein